MKKLTFFTFFTIATLSGSYSANEKKSTATATGRQLNQNSGENKPLDNDLNHICRMMLVIHH